MTAITTAELAIYAVLIIPVIYVLVTHFPHGILGWFYLQAFCLLRIIAGGMALGNNPSALIVANVGLSPLLLAGSGILHEVVSPSGSGVDPKVEWVIVLMFHLLVVAATALVASGGSALQSASPAAGALNKVKAGVGILLLAWVILIVVTAIASCRRRRQSSRISSSNGAKLLIGVYIALVFIGIRLVYTLAAFTSNNPELNPVTGNTAILVCLSLLPELIATLSFVTVGLMTRHGHRDM
ncbi:hypothetical protein VHEMI00367 [[Torrubiella] hemipterigena]|uniref:DUF7702 domain-containing protein n=1 Tax=[Torrubiella] hemipterigena TaxID=1531966 RepID=A0A0A1T4C9_9HYPO|nr:hypothetical protein VHEMI00367 [[Torrubiella] hemipterigena]